MAKEKALSTLLKEANLKIKKLNGELESSESTKTYLQKRADMAELEIESVHNALDAMFVPKTIKGTYQEKTMTIASRLFAWQAGARIDNTKREVE